MKKEIRLKAYAKINLFLEVTGRRADGYHELETVMQTVSLCDAVTVSFDPAGSGITVGCNKKNIPCDRTNIAYKCAEAFLDAQKIAGGVGITIEKRIPVAAGLGGGSADGAAVLRALNDLTGARLSEERLCALGAKLGADIPFCIRGGCVLARGIGEIHEPLPPLRGISVVIAIGSRGSSTPAAYRALDEIGYKAERSVSCMREALGRGDAAGVFREAYNAFERVVLPENRDAAALRAEMPELGADCALMSGSGASVFGLFCREDAAKRACERLREEGFFAALCGLI